MSNEPVREGGSAKERPSRAWGEREGVGGEVRSVVFYKGLRLWEVHLHVFYEAGRLSGGRPSNQPVVPGGSAKKRPSRAWEGGGGGGGRGLIYGVLRGSEALGGSFVCVLGVGEALGGSGV